MQLHYSSSYLATNYGFMDFGTSLAAVDMQGVRRLIFSARDGNVLDSIVIAPTPTLGYQGDVVLPRQFGPDFAFQETEGLPRLFNMSAFNAPLRMNTITANGTPSWADTVNGAAPLTDVTAMQVLAFAGGDLAAIAQRGILGLSLFRLSDGGALTAVAQILDGAKAYLAGISDTAVLMRGADRLLLAISPLENGISSYRISVGGGVEWIDSFGAQNGLPINGLAMLQTASIGGTDFAILASTNSASLTVLRVNAMGVMFQTDHIIDDRSTRFDDILAFDTFTAQGRLFVVAAGSDAGISVFELLPSGRLEHFQTFDLTGGIGLQAVTAIKIEMLGGSAAIFLIDAGGDQILRYDLALENLGARVTAVGGLAVGDGADNLILGSAEADTLQGGGGADVLHDGAGTDVMSGDAGADVFVMTHDGAVDQINGFVDGVDRIDISDWGRIYAVQSLTVTSTSTGAEIAWGDERLIINAGSSLSVTAFSDADFVF